MASVVSALSGLLLALLGLAVLGVRPRRRASLTLGAFALFLGLGYLFRNMISPDDPQFVWMARLVAVCRALEGAFAVAFAASYPRSLQRGERMLLAVAAGVLVVNVLLYSSPETSFVFGPLPLPTADLWPFRLGTSLEVGGFWAALILLALRFPSTEPGLRHRIAWMSGALLIYPGFSTGTCQAGPNVCFGGAQWASLVTLAVVSALWLRNTAHAGTEARAARHVAWAALLLPLAGLMVTALPGDLPRTLGTNGIARILTVALLAYGILRYQVLGLEVKVKWSVSRGTLAGVFLAVFFIVAQLAQNYLSSELGLLAGGVAAGLMLFALTPLQRFAERVADTAMPGVKPVGAMSHDDRVALYRDQLRAAWADGTLTQDERRMLAIARERLRITDAEAMRCEREVACA
jgi:hypothetical protein